MDITIKLADMDAEVLKVKASARGLSADDSAGVIAATRGLYRLEIKR